MNEKLSLEYLGTNGQKRVIKKMIEDKMFLPNVRHIVNPTSFTTESLKKIVSIILNYYDDKGFIPTFKDIEFIMKDKYCADKDYQVMIKEYNEIYESQTLLDGMAGAVNSAVDTMRGIEIMRVLENARNNIKKNGYSEDSVLKYIEELQGATVNKGTTNELNVDELLFQALSEPLLDERVSTGIEEIDDALNGGFQSGSVNLLIAGTGVGKTTLSSIMAMKSAAKEHNRVLHIFFEDTDKSIVKKYCAAMTGEYTSNMHSEYERVEEIRRKIRSNQLYQDSIQYIIPKRMKNGETTFADIKNYIQNLITAKNWKPELVIVDYISCIRLSSDKRLAAQNEFQLLERLMKQFEQLANELNIAILVCSQTNRDAFDSNKKSDRLASVQGSFRITQPCSTILFLERNKEADEKNGINLYIDKCRECEPTSWKGAYLNNGNCQIDLSQVIRTNEGLEFDDDDTKYTAHIG